MVKVKVVKVKFWGLKNEFDHFDLDHEDFLLDVRAAIKRNQIVVMMLYNSETDEMCELLSHQKGKSSKNTALF